MTDRKKRVAIVGIVGVPANYGGYETMVDNMLDYTPDNVEYTVYCSRKAYKERIKEYKGAKLKYFPFEANGPQALLYDLFCTLHAFFHCDTILSLGNNGVLAYPFLRLFGKKKSIYNYDGFECNRDKWSKPVRVLINAVQKTAARYSDENIADNAAIQPLLKERYGIDSHIIEYGGDGAFQVFDNKRLFEKYGLKPQEYYFNVARIEPENNIHIMLEAFGNMPDKQLVIVGNWEKNQYGESLYAKYSDYPNIKLFNPIYEPNEINLLRSNCKLYIHPHSVGGTNPSLVEAMFLGLNIAAFDVIYNRTTTEEKAVYFKDSKELSILIGRGVINDTEMKEIADRRYTWKVIAEKYAELF